VVAEIRRLGKLALPLIVSQIGLMAMLLVDTYMVGKLGSVDLAGLGLGNAFFVTLATLNAGLIFGLDGLFSREQSRGGLSASVPWLSGAAVIATVAALGSILILYLVAWWLPRWGVAPEVAAVTGPYLRAMAWAVPPASYFLLARQFLASHGIVRYSTFVVLLANGVNILLNLVWIPRYGAAGAGMSTAGTRVFMVIFLAPDLWRLIRGHSLRPRLDGLFRIGAATSLHMVARAGVFSVLGLWVARLGVVPMAAHAIVLMFANFLNMIPIGLSTAVAIRVGQGLGREDRQAANISWRAGLWLGGGLMTVLSLALLLGNRFIVSPFAEELAVRDLAAVVLLWVALFQIVDTLQYVVIGALRAYHEYRAALWGTLLGLWAVGLGTAHWLVPHFGLSGIWAGVCVGIVVLFGVTSLVLLRRTT